MKPGLPKPRLIAALALALLCLLAAVPGAAQAAYPGRPGLIVFSLTFHPGNQGQAGGLYGLRSANSNPLPLTDDPEDVEPSFAPSGKKLVFVRWAEPIPGPDPRTTSLYTLDMGSKKTTELTSGHVDRSPSFGRDGMIAFSRYYPASKSSDIVLRAASGRLHRLTFGAADDFSPVFAPDGRRILFVRLRSADWPRTTVYSIEANGSGLHALGRQNSGNNLDVSPNGRRLALNAIRKLPGGKLSGGIWTEPPAEAAASGALPDPANLRPTRPMAAGSSTRTTRAYGCDPLASTDRRRRSSRAATTLTKAAASWLRRRRGSHCPRW